jgi:methionyl-tRNA formyltransferase
MFHLVEEADAGAVYGRETIAIDDSDDAATLNEKINDAGESLVRECYPRIVDGTIDPTPQDETAVTWWPRRRPHHGLIDWTLSARDVFNWIRGQTRPYPGAFTYLDDTKVTIWGADPPNCERVYAKPGEILEARDQTLVVAVWEEALELETVQVSGDGEVPAAQLVEDYRFEVGDVFANARDLLIRPDTR